VNEGPITPPQQMLGVFYICIKNVLILRKIFIPKIDQIKLTIVYFGVPKHSIIIENLMKIRLEKIEERMLT